MRRRDVLVGVGTAGVTALAACAGVGGSGRSGTDTPGTATDAGATASTTSITETAVAATPRPGDVPSDRIVTGAARAADGLAVTADRWFGLRRLRVADGGSRRTVTADQGWFVAFDFTIVNRGESRDEPLPDATFTLRIDDETYEHIHELPGGVPFDAVNQHPTRLAIRELAWYDGLEPGASVSLQLVFEAPERPDYRHYLAWDHDAPVEGALAPVYLAAPRAFPEDDPES